MAASNITKRKFQFQQIQKKINRSFEKKVEVKKTFHAFFINRYVHPVNKK